MRMSHAFRRAAKGHICDFCDGSIRPGGVYLTDGKPLNKESPMPRKNYTPAERALHLIGALAGKSQQEINEAVAYSDAVKMVPVERHKKLPQSSLDMLKRQYRAALTVSPDGPDLAFWGEVWDHCVSPKKLGDL